MLYVLYNLPHQFLRPRGASHLIALFDISLRNSSSVCYALLGSGMEAKSQEKGILCHIW